MWVRRLRPAPVLRTVTCPASPSGTSLADCQALVGDWLAGWDNRRSFHGPALIITAAGEPALASQVGLGDRRDWVVEQACGIAPDRRRRGYATAAVRLARWRLREGPASTVELRIGAGDPDQPAGRRLSRVTQPERCGHGCGPSETYEDLRFVMRTIGAGNRGGAACAGRQAIPQPRARLASASYAAVGTVPGPREQPGGRAPGHRHRRRFVLR